VFHTCPSVSRNSALVTLNVVYLISSYCSIFVFCTLVKSYQLLGENFKDAASLFSRVFVVLSLRESNKYKKNKDQHPKT